MKKYKYIRKGIYKILNTFTNKVYIGKDTYLPYRWYTHKSLLKNNKHYNKKLQNSWNKYGEDVFEFYVIKEFDYNIDYKIINLFEKYYIKKYNSIENGYNIEIGGEGREKYITPESTKLKISLSNKGRKRNKEQIDNIKKSVAFRRKKVWQYDKDYNFIQIWDSLKTINEKLQLNYNSLKYCTSSEKIYLNTYIFSYKPINKNKND